MSGWDAYDWVSRLLAVAFILLGAWWLIRSFFGPEPRADHAALHRGHSVDLGRSWLTGRGSALIFIALGTMNLVFPRPAPRDPRLFVAMGVVTVLVGLWFLLFQHHVATWRRRHYEARLSRRLATGTDERFDELRSLEAYPVKPAPPARTQRIVGVVLILIGSGFLALAYAITR